LPVHCASERGRIATERSQGIPNYVDDSELSVRIVDGLPPSLRDRCVVDRQRHHPEELIRLLSECDVMFSMRLHGCHAAWRR